MTKLFISYRRKSWSFTHRLADELRKRLDAEIFVDMDGVDDTNFEKSILGHLRDSQAVLLVISEHTFADRVHRDDDWVRREIREALTLNIPIVLVCVEGLLPPSGLPDDIKEVSQKQGINFYPDYFTPGIDKLADFVVKIGVAKFPVASAPVIPPPQADTKQIKGRATLDEALDLLDHGDYNKAVFLLEELLENGYTSRYVDVNDLIQQAKTHQETVDRRRHAKLEYEEIESLASRKFTHEQAREAFVKWCDEYPELITELDDSKLSERFQARPSAKRVDVVQPTKEGDKPRKVYNILPPPFEWVKIPRGKVTLEKGGYIPEGGQTFDVSAFEIAKYPVTNAQYGKFIELSGYKQSNWWTSEGWQIRKRENWAEPQYWQDDKWKGDDYPVVGISWYEAIAFCNWLSILTDEPIKLPTEQRWQRAAQGNDNRVYPWGDQWEADRCNTEESGIKQTTPVQKYEGRGDSPFGVVDMAGNVWEWCLTAYESGSESLDGADRRVLRGGSWFYDQDLARAANRFSLNPSSRNSNRGFRLCRPPSS